jgi:gpW
MATPQEQLSQALAAYQDIVTGNRIKVFVDQNGERVYYDSTNLDALRAWILSLQSQIEAGSPTPFVARRPLRVYF